MFVHVYYSEKIRPSVLKKIHDKYPFAVGEIFLGKRCILPGFQMKMFPQETNDWFGADAAFVVWGDPSDRNPTEVGNALHAAAGHLVPSPLFVNCLFFPMIILGSANVLGDLG